MPAALVPGDSLAAALQQAMGERGVSLHWVRRSLAARGVEVDPATLSNWRTGRLVPGTEALPVLAVLEEVLGLQVAELTGRVAGASTGAFARGKAPHRVLGSAPTADSSEPIPAGVQRALDALGFEGPPALEECRSEIHLEVDEHGAQHRVTRRSTWRAVRPGAQRFPVITILPVPVDEHPALTLLAGCTEGPHYTDLAEGIFATAVVLDRALEEGEIAESAHAVALPDGLPSDTSFEHQLRARADEVAVVVDFHPDRLPSVVYGYTLEAPDTPERTHALPEVVGSVAHTVHDFGPGIVGVRWRW